MKNIYTINDLTYVKNNNKIIYHTSCQILHGSITSIKGKNGAGKTTLLKLLYGLYIPTSGNINRNFKRDINQSYVFQNSIFLNRSIIDNLRHVLYCKNIDKLTWNNLIHSSAEEFQLNFLLKLNMKTLSGGELQLLALLRSILIHPDILFLDEPTNNLDTKNISIVANIINSFNSKGCTVILVSHENKLLNLLEHKILKIEKGKIV